MHNTFSNIVEKFKKMNELFIYFNYILENKQTKEIVTQYTNYLE